MINIQEIKESIDTAQFVNRSKQELLCRLGNGKLCYYDLETDTPDLETGQIVQLKLLRPGSNSVTEVKPLENARFPKEIIWSRELRPKSIVLL